MTGRIPKYGQHFRLEHLPYHATWASRRYVSKHNAAVSIRSTNDSEHWQIFIAGPAGAQFPHGPRYDTLGEAMSAVPAVLAVIAY